MKATKTSEDREVDLSADLVILLSRYIPWLREEGLRRGWGEVRWLFPNGAGNHLDHNNVAKDFKQLLKRIGLPNFRLYDLRHTYASLLLARCAPITYVSAQLGHSKPDTTLRHYARWIPREGQTFADLLDKARGEDQVVEKVGTKGWHQNESRDEGIPQPTEIKWRALLARRSLRRRRVRFEHTTYRFEVSRLSDDQRTGGLFALRESMASGRGNSW